jgi:hypothetical protein
MTHSCVESIVINTPKTSILCGDNDDVYLKKNYNEGVTKSDPTKKYTPAKDISKKSQHTKK